jgi:hypothetical protein
MQMSLAILVVACGVESLLRQYYAAELPLSVVCLMCTALRELRSTWSSADWLPLCRTFLIIYYSNALKNGTGRGWLLNTVAAIRLLTSTTNLI